MRRILHAGYADSTKNDSHKVKLFYVLGDSALCSCGGKLGIQNEHRGSISEPVSRSIDRGG